MKVGSLFSGAGLLDYGLHAAGMEHAFLCEFDPWRRARLADRWPAATIYDDIRTLDGEEWRGRVDVVAGGFPCKGASAAGKREGFGHPETVLWHEMHRVIRQARPRYAIVENVANILSIHDGAIWSEVLGSLAALGYDSRWTCLRASDFGAPHLRDRVFLVADRHGADKERNGSQRQEPNGRTNAARECGKAATDAPSAHGQGARPRGETLGRTQSNDASVTSNADNESGPEQDERAPTGQQASHGHDASRRGLRVGFPWGEYEPAIRRWESLFRPAPAPLTGVHGLDDGNAAVPKVRKGVDRRRVSAHGDGVFVMAARAVGEYVMHMEAS